MVKKSEKYVYELPKCSTCGGTLTEGGDEASCAYCGNTYGSAVKEKFFEDLVPTSRRLKLKSVQLVATEETALPKRPAICNKTYDGDKVYDSSGNEGTYHPASRHVDVNGVRYELTEDGRCYVEALYDRPSETLCLDYLVVFGQKIPVYSIVGTAFKGCDTITSVYIGDTVATVGTEAFSDCAALESVVLGTGIYDIGEEAFARCKALSAITFTAQDKGHHKRKGCGRAATAEKLDIGVYAFRDCDSLKTLGLPPRTHAIREGAFFHCENLETVFTGDGVESMGSFAFAHCHNLGYVALGKGLKTLDFAVFEDTNIKELHIQSSRLERVDVGPDLWGRLEDCDVCFDAGCTRIPPRLFFYNGEHLPWRLQSIYIADSVKYIGPSAFPKDCCSVSGEVFFGGSAKDIPEIECNNGAIDDAWVYNY